MDRNAIIECRGVVKRYGRETVLTEVDLDLDEGEVLGLLGPNGAGKTTLIKILLGLATPNSGTVRIFGEDLFRTRKRLRRRIGAIVEAPVFFEYLSAMENLRALVSLNGPTADADFEDVLGLVGLADVAGERVGTFSQGMKQRLGIAQALLPANRLVILDEPTNGLDPHGIAGIRQLIRRLSRDRGVTVLVSSHLLAEVEQVCDRVVILNRGRVVQVGRVDDLGVGEARSVEIRVGNSPAVLAAAREAGGCPVGDAAEEGVVTLAFHTGHDGAPALVKRLVEAGGDIWSVQCVRVTLEDVFLRETAQGDGDVRVDAFGG